MTKEIKNSGIKDNDRVELSSYFEVYSHGNGFQLKREDTTYSIIPIKRAREGFGQYIGWEVNSDKHRFDNLVEAIEYVLEKEQVEVPVWPIKDFYELGDKNESN